MPRRVGTSHADLFVLIFLGKFFDHLGLGVRKCMRDEDASSKGRVDLFTSRARERRRDNVATVGT